MFVKRIGPCQILSVAPDVMKRSMVAQCAHIGFHTQCGIRLPTPEPTYDQAQIASVLTECDIRSSATTECDIRCSATLVNVR